MYVESSMRMRTLLAATQRHYLMSLSRFVGIDSMCEFQSDLSAFQLLHVLL